MSGSPMAVTTTPVDGPSLVEFLLYGRGAASSSSFRDGPPLPWSGKSLLSVGLAPIMESSPSARFCQLCVFLVDRRRAHKHKRCRCRWQSRQHRQSHTRPSSFVLRGAVHFQFPILPNSRHVRNRFFVGRRYRRHCRHRSRPTKRSDVTLLEKSPACNLTPGTTAPPT